MLESSRYRESRVNELKVQSTDVVGLMV